MPQTCGVYGGIPWLTGLNNLRTTYRQDVLMMKNIFNQENPIKIDASTENLTKTNQNI